MTTPRPNATRIIGRGLTVACPVCGNRRIRRRLLGVADRCGRCQLRFEREPGHWIGAVATNTMMTVGALALAELVLFAVTYPGFEWKLLLGVNLIVGVSCPVLFYPVSKTLWTALTLLMEPPRPAEVDDEHAWPASTVPTRAARPSR